ncbi:MAG: hypothetical protein WC445_02195 [Patescibacteria group bacterium]
METTSADKRQNPVQNQFERLVAALRMEESAVADWLEETRDDLAGIFGETELALAWENISFLSYIWVMLGTIEKMREKGRLPTITVNSYLQATREWNDREIRAQLECEILKAMQTFQRESYEDFETLLSGSPSENQRAESCCRGKLAKLLRLVRLSQQ